MEDFKSLLQLEFSPYGILTTQQLTLLEQHYQLLIRCESEHQFNLASRTLAGLCSVSLL